MKAPGRDNRTKMSATGSTSVKVPTTPLYSSSKGAATKTSGFNPARVKAEHPPLPTTTPVQQGAFRKAPTGQGPMKMAQQAYSSSRPGGAGIPAMAPAKPMYGTPSPPLGLPAGAPPSDPYSDAAKAYSQQQRSEPPSAPTFRTMSSDSAVSTIGKALFPTVDKAAMMMPKPMTDEEKMNLARAFGKSIDEVLYPEDPEGESLIGKVLFPTVDKAAMMMDDELAMNAYRSEQERLQQRADASTGAEDKLMAQLGNPSDYGIDQDVLDANIESMYKDMELKKQQQLLQQQAQAGAMGIQGTGSNLFQMGNIQSAYANAAQKMENEMRMDNEKLKIQDEQAHLGMLLQKATADNNREAQKELQDRIYALEQQKAMIELAIKGPETIAILAKEYNMPQMDAAKMQADLNEAMSKDPPDLAAVYEVVSKVGWDGENAYYGATDVAPGPGGTGWNMKWGPGVDDDTAAELSKVGGEYAALRPPYGELDNETKSQIVGLIQYVAGQGQVSVQDAARFLGLDINDPFLTEGIFAGKLN